MELKFKTLEIRKIGNEEVNSVSLRELHKELGIKKDFSDWVKVQIKRGFLEEGIDYIIFHQKSEKSLLHQKGEQKKVGGSNKIEYISTIDVAKSIAMMSATKKGKEIRKYFINVEKVAKKMLGEKKLELEIKKLETEEKLLHESIIDKRVERVKKLQELGCNFDPMSIINPELLTGSKIDKNTAEALTDAYSDIRPNIRAYSATYLLKKFNVGILTPEWNNYLIELGYMESYIYNERRYKKFVKDVNYYGYNKHFSSVKKDPMQPYYYEDRFMNLVTLLRNEGYID